MNRAGYEAYITSDAWRARRSLALKRDRHRCQGCGRDTDLHVHHRTYERFKSERLSDLVTVCQGCHDVIHSMQAITGRNLAAVTDEVLAMLTRPGQRLPEPARPFAPRHERQSLQSRKRDGWRRDSRNGGTWAQQARQRDVDASARRINGLLWQLNRKPGRSLSDSRQRSLPQRNAPRNVTICP